MVNVHKPTHNLYSNQRNMYVYYEHDSVKLIVTYTSDAPIVMV